MDSSHLVSFSAGLMLSVFIVVMVTPNHSEKYMEKCRDAGGVPAITARGPDVCINPSALIKGVE